jgi:hypothetical protein
MDLRLVLTLTIPFFSLGEKGDRYLIGGLSGGLSGGLLILIVILILVEDIFNFLKHNKNQNQTINFSKISYILKYN